MGVYTGQTSYKDFSPYSPFSCKVTPFNNTPPRAYAIAALSTRSRFKVERALSLFNRQTLNRISIDHCRPYVTMSQQFLNRAYIVIGL
jgi:hypothetical protein